MIGLLALGLYSSIGFYRLGVAIESVVELETPLFENISDIEIIQLEQSVALREGVLDAVQHGPDSSGYKKEVRHFESLNGRVDAELHHAEEILAEMILAGAGAASLATIEHYILEAEQHHKLYEEKVKELFHEIDSSAHITVESLDHHMESILPLDHQLSETLDKANKAMKVRLNESGLALEHLEIEMMWIQIIMTVAFCLAGGVLSILIYKSISTQLGGDPADLLDLAERIADGDLTTNISNLEYPANSVLASMCKMNARLLDVVVDVVAISESVNRGSRELLIGSAGLSERTAQQAASIEETAASTEEIVSTVRDNATNSQRACELAENTCNRAAEGGKTAGAAVAAMEGISSASEQIRQIVSVIDEIAFQTNLLALNAAVEAARAGEQGRGFAVVATEVRQLAGRSAEAAKEIKELIEDNVRRVKDGSLLVSSSGEELQTMVGSITELSQIISEISKASEEQTLGVSQINEALVQLDTATQQNAALAEESTDTCQVLAKVSKELEQRMAFFDCGRPAMA